MVRYSVKKLADLAGVSVRTLHLYDQMGLLVPTIRTPAGYRLYGEQELLRLQQILFYKELDIPLKQISEILDDPSFDLLQALEGHRAALLARKDRIATLIDTIDKTIQNVKKGVIMLPHEELYKGLPKEKAAAYRKEAIEKWGAEKVEGAENALLSMPAGSRDQFQEDFKAVWSRLASMRHLDPLSTEVQQQVARHYALIGICWGMKDDPAKQLKAYGCLGDLYMQDERYTAIDGEPNPAFASFMKQAIGHFTGKAQ